MTKKKLSVDPNQPLEIVVSTYWPTRIIKEIQVTNPSKDSWHNDITFSKSEAEYLYEQLTPMFGERVKTTDSSHFVKDVKERSDEK